MKESDMKIMATILVLTWRERAEPLFFAAVLLSWPLAAWDYLSGGWTHLGIVVETALAVGVAAWGVREFYFRAGCNREEKRRLKAFHKRIRGMKRIVLGKGDAVPRDLRDGYLLAFAVGWLMAKQLHRELGRRDMRGEYPLASLSAAFQSLSEASGEITEGLAVTESFTEGLESGLRHLGLLAMAVSGCPGQEDREPGRG